MREVTGQWEWNPPTGSRHPLGGAEVEGAGDALWQCHRGFAPLNQKDQLGEPRRDVQSGSRPAGPSAASSLARGTSTLSRLPSPPLQAWINISFTEL